jgi:hypothetical protein
MTDIAGIEIPDSTMARDLTRLIRDIESPLLFHHSSRVYHEGALASAAISTASFEDPLGAGLGTL